MPTPTANDTDPTHADGVAEARHHRLILLAVCTALMAVMVSVTGLNVAQPALAAGLAAAPHSVLWIINSYTITLAAMLLPLGALGDRLGLRRTLSLGLSVFAVANVVAGLAPSVAVLSGARVLGGVGAALVMPVTLAVITSIFPESERPRAIGAWTAVAGGGGIVGMFVSAVLVDLASWRHVSVLPVGLALAALMLTRSCVPNLPGSKGNSFDTIGAATSIVAVGGSSFVLHEGPVRGWGDPVCLAVCAIAAAAATGFVHWERRRRSPLLDLRLFGHRDLQTGSAILLTVFGVQAGVVIVCYPYLQSVLGWTGLRATLALMPMAGLTIMASVVGPRLAAAIGEAFTVLTGILLTTTGLVLLAALVDTDGGYPSIVAGLLAIGCGMGLTMPLCTAAITRVVPPRDQGVASALNDVTREFGASLGVALFGALLAAGYQRADTPTLGAGPGELAHAARESFLAGWRVAMWTGAALMAGLFMCVFALSILDKLGRPGKGSI